jgi:hypothetical protein
VTNIKAGDTVVLKDGITAPTSIGHASGKRSRPGQQVYPDQKYTVESVSEYRHPGSPPNVYLNVGQASKGDEKTRQRALVNVDQLELLYGGKYPAGAKVQLKPELTAYAGSFGATNPVLTVVGDWRDGQYGDTSGLHKHGYLKTTTTGGTSSRRPASTRRSRRRSVSLVSGVGRTAWSPATRSATTSTRRRSTCGSKPTRLEPPGAA